MGVGISSWQLAAEVARRGQMGVVSGTALEIVHARRLQLGDPGGHLRRAFEHFPVPAIARRVLDRYYISGGKGADEPYRSVPMYTLPPATALQELSVVTNFAEVWLAKEAAGGGLIGINYLRKIELPLPAAMFGAVLAGVDHVIVGAGNPDQIPPLLTKLARGDDAALDIKVQYAGADDRFQVEFSPRALMGPSLEPMRRPRMLAIVASVGLARALAQHADEPPDGFIIEGATAGGHNAPPQGPVRLDGRGQPIYGPLDVVDLREIQRLGRPFWLAGSYGSAEGLRAALSAGAAGVQVGTAFAFCRESGLASDLKARILRRVIDGEASVFTDPRASPTGFPFKVVELPGTLSDSDVYAARRRICDLGYLRCPYKSAQGRIGYRCPAEPEAIFVHKQGRPPNTQGRKCLCNALLANIGLGQLRSGGHAEPALVTSGDDLRGVGQFLAEGATSYGAADVMARILG
jgi:NAD(P)H-dependent flavin oxidoreductase YrpB (nitropropane dioxygenase family)